MPLDTLIFDPSPCGFPRPRVPLLPTGLDGASFKPHVPWASAGHFRNFARGRYALREAYRLAGVGPECALLAPAYHCRTMLDPALALGGNVLLYPLRPDLTPDVAALETLAENSPTPIRALLATHFFGLPKPFEALAAWCAQHSITLVEDCSHAFVTEQYRPEGIGMHGQFVVSSPYKFLPSPDGGLLYARSATQLTDIRPTAPAFKDELRGIAHMRSKAAEHRRGRAACDAARIDVELSTIMQKPTPSAREARESTGCSVDYRREEEGRGALRTSRWLCRHADIEHVANHRRENYQRWAAATMDLPYCRPLFPDLSTGCTPYMFPLLVDQPEPRFSWLKRMGVPIWRWDSIAASNCPTANDCRLRLLHLPCHQSLDDRELDWMIAVIQEVGARGAAPLLQ